MRKKSLHLLFILILISSSAFSQWTRTSADTTNITNLNSGSVGIGTTAPGGTGEKLTVATPSGTSQGNIAVFRNSTNNAYSFFAGAGSSSAVPTWSNGSQILELVPYSTGNGVISSYTGSLLFQTNNRSNRMIIDQNGRVGIGTLTPAAALDVGGAIQISSTASSTPPADLGYGFFGYSGIGMGIYSGAVSAGQGIGIWTNPGGTKTEVMRILSGGQVGIGTTSPTSLLDVRGENGVNITLPATGDFGGSQDGVNSKYVHFTAASAGDGTLGAPVTISDLTFSSAYWRIILQGSFDNNYEGAFLSQMAPYVEVSDLNNTVEVGAVKLTFTKNTSNQIQVQASTASGIAARSAGFKGEIRILPNIGGTNAGTNSAIFTNNVGIGTIHPDELLAVKGNIHAQEVKIDLSGWSDYVFKPSYQLPPLSFVKNYIGQNQHLPDMPSEAELKKNGLKVGQMENILTKKVEELTLYLIEKDKQLEDQKKQIEQQEQRLKKLEALLNK